MQAPSVLIWYLLSGCGFPGPEAAHIKKRLIGSETGQRKRSCGLYGAAPGDLHQFGDLKIVFRAVGSAVHGESHQTGHELPFPKILPSPDNLSGHVKADNPGKALAAALGGKAGALADLGINNINSGGQNLYPRLIVRRGRQRIILRKLQPVDSAVTCNL
jgi:hypothetical protein